MLKYVAYIAGTLILLLTLIILFISIFTAFSDSALTKSISDNKDIITSIVSLINLLFVVSVFLFNVIRERKKKSTEKKDFWLRKLTTERKIFDVIHFFEHTINDLKDVKIHSNDVKIYLDLVNNKWHICVCEFTDIIRIIDRPTAITMDSCLEECLDILTKAAERVLVNNEDSNTVITEYQGKLNELKTTCLKYLYDLDNV